MAIQNTSEMLFIIDGVPISFLKNHYAVTNVSEDNTSSIVITGGFPEKDLYKLGSSLPSLYTSTNENPIIKRNAISTSYTVDFWVTNQTTQGQLINNILMPLLNAARRAIDVPCQFAYEGYYMALGYLEDYTNTFDPTENRHVYTARFQENIYRTYSDENTTDKDFNAQNSVTDNITNGAGGDLAKAQTQAQKINVSVGSVKKSVNVLTGKTEQSLTVFDMYVLGGVN